MRQTAFRDSTEPVSTVSDAPPAYLLQEKAVGAPVRTTTEEVDQTPEQTDTRPSREEKGSLTCGFVTEQRVASGCLRGGADCGKLVGAMERCGNRSDLEHASPTRKCTLCEQPARRTSAWTPRPAGSGCIAARCGRKRGDAWQVPLRQV